jgi:HAD superfamily hydrolase (TIGR01549 family)
MWDFDGTLFDTYPVMGKAFQETLAEAGYVESLEDVMTKMKVSMGYAMEYYKGKYEIDEAFLDTYDKRRMALELEECVLFEGVKEICEAVCLQGGTNYLVTHRGSSAFGLMEAHGLMPFFEDFVTGESGFARKPSPEGIEYLLGKYKLPVRECLMIGDRELDVLAGKNAGVDACLFTMEKDVISAADYVVGSMRELRDIVF